MSCALKQAKWLQTDTIVVFIVFYGNITLAWMILLNYIKGIISDFDTLLYVHFMPYGYTK